MKKKFNKLNTYYLKKFRRKAASMYRVITVIAGYELQHWEEVCYGAFEYTYCDYQWKTIKFFDDKTEARDACDELRRAIILNLVKNARRYKEEKIGEIY